MGLCRRRSRDFHDVVVVVALVFFSGGVVQESQQGALFGDSSPLYGPEDQVFVLNVTNLKNHIYGSNRAWVVEFFSSWCGHCIHFAPKWKQLALDVAPWQNVLVVSGIDCADESNVAVCREYEIMGYPSLRYFPPGAHATTTLMKDGERKQETNLGDVIDRSESINDMKRKIMDNLVLSLTTFQTPDLSTQIIDADQLWTYAKLKIKPSMEMPSFILLVFESETSYIGKEVALNLSKYPSIMVIRFVKKAPLYTFLGLDGWMAAGYFRKDREYHDSGPIRFEKNQNYADFLMKTVTKLAHLPAASAVTPNIHEKIESEDKVRLAKDKEEGENQLSNNIEEPSTNVNLVSMEDLIHAIRNSLRNEVGLYNQITGTKLQSLKNYLHTLAEFFPADRREMIIFLAKLSSWLLPFEQLDGTTYLDKLTELEVEFHPWDIDVHSWGNCKGSVSGRRGYTCSLWSLFHTLTVIAYEKNQDFPVLDSIHSFVKEFFGCSECAGHFTKMISDDGALMITSIKDQVLWLWRAHNNVNLRLKGALSEDPAYPKIQYPSQAQCDHCYDKNNTFVESNVLEFLLKVYSKPVRTLQPFKMSSDRLRGNDDAHRNDSGRQFSGFFSGMDYWLFCVVYLSVAVLLVFGYVHFRGRGRVDVSYLLCKRLLLKSAVGKNNV